MLPESFPNPSQTPKQKTKQKKIKEKGILTIAKVHRIGTITANRSNKETQIAPKFNFFKFHLRAFFLE